MSGHPLARKEVDADLKRATPFERLEEGKCYKLIYEHPMTKSLSQQYSGRLLRKVYLGEAVAKPGGGEGADSYNVVSKEELAAKSTNAPVLGPVFDLFFGKTSKFSVRGRPRERYISPIETMYNKHYFVETECEKEDDPMERRKHMLTVRKRSRTNQKTRRSRRK